MKLREKIARWLWMKEIHVESSKEQYYWETSLFLQKADELFIESSTALVTEKAMTGEVVHLLLGDLFWGVVREGLLHTRG